MAFKVPGGISKLGLPATVTVARLARVSVLPVATPGSRQPPAIVLKKPDQLSDLHALPVSLTLPCNLAAQRPEGELREPPVRWSV